MTRRPKLSLRTQRCLNAQAAVISTLMRQVGIASLTIDGKALVDEWIYIDVDRDDDGVITEIRVRRAPVGE